MARIVRWTEIAWDDLERAADYIARDSSYYAAAFVMEIRDAARSLDILAGRGRIVPEFNHTDIREIFVHRYRLIYQVTEQFVSILALIHGARDLPTAWGERQRPTP